MLTAKIPNYTFCRASLMTIRALGTEVLREYRGFDEGLSKIFLKK